MGSFILLAIYFHMTAVVFENIMADGKPESSPISVTIRVDVFGAPSSIA